MKAAIFQYKCRMCGKVYNDSCSSEKIALMILVSTVIGSSMPKNLIGIKPEMVSIHSTCEMGSGVSDLIGFIVEEK